MAPAPAPSWSAEAARLCACRTTAARKSSLGYNVVMAAKSALSRPPPGTSPGNSAPTKIRVNIIWADTSARFACPPSAGIDPCRTRRQRCRCDAIVEGDVGKTAVYLASTSCPASPARRSTSTVGEHRRRLNAADKTPLPTTGRAGPRARRVSCRPALSRPIPPPL